MVDSKIVEVCKVTPPLGSPTEMCLPLTFFDLFCSRFSPPEMLFFYDTRLPEPVFTDSVLPKLKHSLSLTLKYFLPVAGSLTWPSSSPNPVIRYKEGDGVLFTVAVTDDADFNHFTSKNTRECKIFRPLVARIVGSDSQVPVFAIKVTLFPNKGFCIGTTLHHSLFDAKSAELFMKAWASISKFGENKQGLSPDLNPNFDRKVVREQYTDIEDSFIEYLKKNGVGPNRLPVLECEPAPGTVRGTFQLSGLDVRKLKELVRAGLEKCEGEELNFRQVPYISTFSMTYAYVIVCLVKAKGLTINNRIRIAFPFNCRGRLEPPLPTNYFGSCIGTFATYIDGEDLLREDLMILVLNFIIKNIKGLEKGALRGAEEWLPNLFKAAASKQTVKIYALGSSKYKFKSIDFGWGKPRKADQTMIDGTGGIAFADGDGGGAIEIELSLIRSEMERFASVFAKGLTELVKYRSAAL